MTLITDYLSICINKIYNCLASVHWTSSFLIPHPYISRSSYQCL